MLLPRILRGIATSRPYPRARRARTLLALLVATASVTCSVDELAYTLPPVTIGGTVTGLDGAGLVLTNNGGDDLVITGDGAFAFATPLERGASYALAVKSQPSNPTQTCSITNGNGTAGDADVIDVQVSCHTTTLRVGGTVTGLAGSGLVLQNNGGDSLSVSADGAFTFATPVPSGASYDVTVAMQPALPTQECTVANGTGTVGTSDVTNIEITCTTRSFTIGGTVTGLSGTGLVLQNNGGDDLAIGVDGSFTFATPIESGAMFAVTVLAQPSEPAQTCTVAGGTGTVGGGDVTSVAINCTTNRYMIGGTISGLIGTVTLQNNGGDDLAVTANGMFAFATPVPSGASYDVTVRTQPTQPWQTCRVTAGSGTVTNADVTSVVVICTTNRYAIGGTLSGLAPGNSITLRNNGGDDLVVSADGNFSFPLPVLSGQPYAVTIVADPTTPVSQHCTVTNGAGLVEGSDITSVGVTCSTNAFTIGGTVTGLVGSGLVLQNNGGDDLAIGADGSFTFPTPVASGEPFEVTVLAQPAGPSQTCTVAGGTGIVGTGDVTSVAVTCTTNKFSIGGTISGLAGTVTLRNTSNGDMASIATNGGFVFGTPVASGEPYNVIVVSQPPAPAQTCTVTGGSGTVTNASIHVVVTCTTNRYPIGGTLSGLAAGNSITLRNNGGNDLVLSANGGFTFATPVASGLPYAVTIVAQPVSPIAQTCIVTNGTGTVGSSNVTNVQVTCVTNRYTIGGTVSGLAGAGLVLQNNGGDNLAISANGSFTFATPLASGSMYAVTVLAQPTAPWQNCTVSGGSGPVGAGNVTSIAVTCTTNRYSVGGTISGLAGTVTLRNNGGDEFVLTMNGPFGFATTVPSGGTYAVTVQTQPTAPAQTCTVTAGSGTVTSADITSVVVTCTTNRYSIGGTLAGLAPGNSITLRNNGGDDLVRSANGGFTFPATVASGQPYAVTIVANPTSPISQACTVTNGTGIVGSSNVTNVQVTCTTNKYTIGGTVTGLTGTGLVLQNNGGDDLTINANGTFTFPTPVASGATYNVAIKTQPSGKSCWVSGGTGTVGASNVTSVGVTCGAGTLVTINQGTNRLQRIDASTLAVTDIGLFGAPYAFGDCAWNAADSTLYVIDGRASNALYRVNLATGAATLVGVHGITDMFSLAYHPPTNKLYGIGGNRNLYTLSTTTGAATLIGPTGMPTYVDGLAWDSKRNVMVALIAGSALFYAVNVTTGAATQFHSSTHINNLGMTYDPVVDRFWVVDYDRKFIEFDPNNNFARTQRFLLSGAYTCLAFVP